MLSEQALEWIRQAYLVGFVGAFFFLIVLEDGQRPAEETGRLRHVLRNLGVFALVLLLADGVVLGLMFRTPYRLTESDGLLTSLKLNPLVLCAIGFVLLDLVEYGFHRLSHRWHWLWRLHAVHHSDPMVDASTALRSHPVEVSISVVVKVMLCLGLGIPLWAEGARAVVANPWALFQHANLAGSGRVNRSLGWLLATPAMHKIHHSTDLRETNTNFGVIFSCWDRFFGTYAHPQDNATRTFGVAGLTGESWQTLTGMLLTPLRARNLDIPR